MSSDQSNLTVELDGERIDVCHARAHDWAEGDNEHIYCVACNGAMCDTCGGRGVTLDGRGCYRCSKHGVLYWYGYYDNGEWIDPNHLAIGAREIDTLHSPLDYA